MSTAVREAIVDIECPYLCQHEGKVWRDTGVGLAGRCLEFRLDAATTSCNRIPQLPSLLIPLASHFRDGASVSHIDGP